MGDDEEEIANLRMERQFALHRHQPTPMARDPSALQQQLPTTPTTRAQLAGMPTTASYDPALVDLPLDSEAAQLANRSLTQGVVQAAPLHIGIFTSNDDVVPRDEQAARHLIAVGLERGRMATPQFVGALEQVHSRNVEREAAAAQADEERRIKQRHASHELYAPL